MNSAPLSSANDVRDAAYHRNQVKSLCFLALLAVVLVAAALLSLRAGSYNTPLAELVRGVFGLAQDEKINLVDTETSQATIPLLFLPTNI